MTSRDRHGRFTAERTTSPVPVPPQAITAAAVAIHDVDCRDDRCSGSALGHCYKLARAALGAAAPLLAAAERETIARLAEQSEAMCPPPSYPFRRPPGWRPFAPLLREGRQ